MSVGVSVSASVNMHSYSFAFVSELEPNSSLDRKTGMQLFYSHELST